MSRTIDDFMRFYHPEKRKTDFYISEVMEHALPILLPILQKSDIELHFNNKSLASVNGYMNEYTQVVISILTNAKDMLLHRKIKKACINIDLYETDRHVVLSISDNAGGVRKENMQRIFDPYFTTKHKAIGTGLGLYISKMIIEKNMGGLLSVENKNDGAVFKIEMGKTDAK
jgi:C4-dicarboxylate-specific signal transduction histidine kinase